MYVEVTEDGAVGGLVASEEFVSAQVPAPGWPTALVLRVERDGEPFQRIPLPNHWERA